MVAAGLSTARLPPLGLMLGNGLVVALLIAGGKIAISAIVWFRFPFRRLAFWTIFVTLMLPVEVRILPTCEVVGLGLLDSTRGSRPR